MRIFLPEIALRRVLPFPELLDEEDESESEDDSSRRDDDGRAADPAAAAPSPPAAAGGAAAGTLWRSLFELFRRFFDFFDDFLADLDDDLRFLRSRFESFLCDLRALGEALRDRALRSLDGAVAAAGAVLEGRAAPRGERDRERDRARVSAIFAAAR